MTFRLTNLTITFFLWVIFGLANSMTIFKILWICFNTNSIENFNYFIFQFIILNSTKNVCNCDVVSSPISKQENCYRYFDRFSQVFYIIKLSLMQYKNKNYVLIIQSSNLNSFEVTYNISKSTIYNNY